MTVRKEIITAMKDIVKFMDQLESLCVYAAYGETDKNKVVKLKQMYNDLTYADEDVYDVLNNTIDFVKDNYGRKQSPIILPDELKEKVYEIIKLVKPISEVTFEYLTQKIDATKKIYQEITDRFENETMFNYINLTLNKELAKYFKINGHVNDSLNRLIQILETGVSTYPKIEIDQKTDMDNMDYLDEYFKQKYIQEYQYHVRLNSNKKEQEKHFISDDIYYIEDEDTLIFNRSLDHMKIPLVRQYFHVSKPNYCIAKIYGFDLVNLAFSPYILRTLEDGPPLLPIMPYFVSTEPEESKKIIAENLKGFNTLEEAEREIEKILK